MQHPLCRLQLAVFLSFQLEFAFFFLGGKTSAIFKTEDNAVIVRSFVPRAPELDSTRPRAARDLRRIFSTAVPPPFSFFSYIDVFALFFSLLHYRVCSFPRPSFSISFLSN